MGGRVRRCNGWYLGMPVSGRRGGRRVKKGYGRHIERVGRRPCKWRGCNHMCTFGSQYCADHNRAAEFHGGAVLAPDVKSDAFDQSLEHLLGSRHSELDGGYQTPIKRYG